MDTTHISAKDRNDSTFRKIDVSCLDEEVCAEKAYEEIYHLYHDRMEF